jgi:hypothetical protein
METVPLLNALSKVEQLLNIRFHALNDKFQHVFALIDALNANVFHLTASLTILVKSSNK